MSSGNAPGEDAWKKMSPLARKIYWACVVIALGIIGGALLFKLFSH